MRLLRVKHLGSALATAECQPSAGPVAGSAAGYGGDDAEGLALGHGGVESLEEPHVVVGHEDVGEAPDAAIGVEDPLGEAGVGGPERGQPLAGGGPITLDSSGERRVGKEWFSPCRYRWWPCH